ncbi:MAG: PPOX class F420-dependent oxidoreductase [Actinomycetota bacterium]|nr:PPOX class F420-dependent oxidoreductase [Actinomycetota bacterium]
MKKIPKDDPRAKRMSSDIEVDRAGLIEFVSGKSRWVLSTTRADGRPQMSLVTGTITPAGELLISTYPQRVKTLNAKRNPLVSVAVMGDEFNGEWVQIDGEAEVSDAPDSVDGLVEYFQCIRGDHPDWDEYRQAMLDQGKSVIRITPTRWSPVSKGGFPPSLFED